MSVCTLELVVIGVVGSSAESQAVVEGDRAASGIAGDMPGADEERGDGPRFAVGERAGQEPGEVLFDQAKEEWILVLGNSVCFVEDDDDLLVGAGDLVDDLDDVTGIGHHSGVVSVPRVGERRESFAPVMCVFEAAVIDEEEEGQVLREDRTVDVVGRLFVGSDQKSPSSASVT